MVNNRMPTQDELPSPRQLVRSTLIAVIVAAVLLVIAILPAEYGWDPTGIGNKLGLKKMGAIKVQLRDEAKAESQPTPMEFQVDSTEPRTNEGAPTQRIDSIAIVLDPDQGAEVKVVLRKGRQVSYRWSVPEGLVNHDTHGDGDGISISYLKGRQVAGDSGKLTAAFDGTHGWFWRNRGDRPVVLQLHVNGEHTGFQRVN